MRRTPINRNAQITQIPDPTGNNSRRSPCLNPRTLAVAGLMLLLSAWSLSLGWKISYSFGNTRVLLHGGALCWMPRLVFPPSTRDDSGLAICRSEVRQYWWPQYWHTGSFVIPFWCFIPLLAIGFVTNYRRNARWSVCANCDYLLIGNVSGVCPECGTAIPSSGQDDETKVL